MILTWRPGIRAVALSITLPRRGSATLTRNRLGG
jgi:hypothetical protein